MTAGVGMVVGRAMVRDVSEGAQAQRLMSHVAMAFALAPAVAPVLGGWLHVWAGWRSVFVFLALVTALIALWCWRDLPETLPPHQRRPWSPRQLARAYGQTLTTPAFVAVSLAVTFFFVGFFVYVLSAPVFLMRHLQLGETQFLWFFGPNTAAMMLGSWLSAQLAGHLSRRGTLGAGVAVMAAAATANVVLNVLAPPAVPWSMTPIAVYVLGMALAMPSLNLLALDLFPQRRGLAASCQGFVQSGFNAVAAGVIAPLLWSAPLVLAAGEAAFVLMGVIALSACWLALRARTARNAAEGAQP
ncbi:MAG: MFS transporter [Candidatus Latescibacterota bacterium]